MLCPSCGTENQDAAKFCVECGTGLALACPSCGTPHAPGQRFCAECGAQLASSGAQDAPPREAPAAERRLVTVLFADLVGFTPLSESRDAEEVRELLSRYFDTCRRLISLYGGTVEKFIGDAVMAVWGTPTATEDDAERAVRAALDLVAAVSALGQEVGAEDLRARAGVLTGEAAVTLAAEDEGMVAGDLVNTSSRVQSVAEPGAVYVGESTRRATEQTIVYEEAGSFELKGKEGLTPLWRAQRVVSGLRGSLKSHGLEAPFVGRDRELRQIKDLFHASAEEGKAHLISVTGIAGIGKSRLAWEFYKYFDGIAETVYWHRGRCLPYGEGVTYWALADMVRMRCRISEDEEPDSALRKLRSALEEHILDAEERSFLEPRLAHLLGLAEHQARDQQDLFAAWRLFFERLAETYPTVLAFEDMQWADVSLLDFVEYMLDWSRGSPILVLTLARPELLERRPTWGAGQRSFTSLFLEPLTPRAMEGLLTGLVPGLPDTLQEQILARAEGVPLYAVETVRMLLDRGLLVQDGPAYRVTGPVDQLEVPETLHALIAARLDGVTAEERRLLQDGAVLGKTFTKAGLTALSGLDEGTLEELLASLVRKEVLGVQADPRSPEHGQYGFLQDLVRHVAYETLSRRERRSRHLAAAEHLTKAFAADEDEVVEVIASHYLDAYEVAPDADDAGEIKGKARAMLVRAGERAASLAASAEARRYFEQGAGLAEDPLERAELLDRAALMANYAAETDKAEELFAQSIALYEGEGEVHAAARVSSRLARLEAQTGRLDRALERGERAIAAMHPDEPELAILAARLSNGYWFAGDLARATERVEQALDLAEALGLPEPLAIALRTKGVLAATRGHRQEFLALVKHSLQVCLDEDLPDDASVAYFVLSDDSFRRDRYDDALAYLQEGLELCRRVGTRPGEWSFLAETTYPLFMRGRWDEALSVMEELTEEQARSGGMFLSLLTGVLEIHLARGHLDEADRLFGRFAGLQESADVQDQACLASATAALRRAEGRFQEALEAGTAAAEVGKTLAVGHQAIEQGLVEAIESALALAEHEQARELIATIEAIPPGARPPYLEAQAKRFRARLERDAAGLETAAARFRELGIQFWLAVTLLEHAELTGNEDSRTEAREIFERLGATPWLERSFEIGRPAEEAVT
jgi:class 3 adenylate cyclase/tetratricopeptide (TPR) repeat protein